MAKPYSNRRLFDAEGVNFLRWIEPEEVQRMLAADEITVAIHPRTDRPWGFKLKHKVEQLRDTASLLPFSRPTRPEDRFRYEIPRAGDCRTICLRRYGLRRFLTSDHKVSIARKIIKVSARKIDFTRPPYRTTPSGLTMPLFEASSALNSSAAASNLSA